MDVFPTEPALEAAVIAHADEDTPRLVYADWLDEHGDPDRAAFIRVQCRLADLPPDAPDWCALDVQQGELVRRLRSRFTDLVPRWSRSPDTYRRGFRFSVDLSAYPAEWNGSETARVAAILGQLIATTTIRGANCHGAPSAQFTALASCPAFGELQQLDFSFGHGVDIGTAAAVKALVGGGRDLRRLHVSASIWPEMIDGFAAPGAFPDLRRLWLSHVRTSADNVHRLMAADWMRGLWELDLGYLHDHMEPALACAGELPELHTLNLIRPTAADADRLSAGPFPRLARLACPDARIKLRGLQTLLAAPWAPQLRSLDLTSNELGDRALFVLTEHPVGQHIRDLRLGNNSFGKKGLLAFTERDAFPELVRLDLSLTNDNKRKATEADVAAFLSRLAHPRLRSLNLKGLPVGEVGVEAIANNPALGELRELYLGDGVSKDSRNALRACEHLRQTTLV